MLLTQAGSSDGIQVAKKTTSKKTARPEALTTVINDFNNAWEYTQSSWHQRWEDNYSLYHNKRVKVGYQGITDTFVPMTFSTIETMVAALFGGKPKFNFIPPHDKPDQNTEILNAVLDYFWDKDKWNVKVINWGRSMLMLGTSVVYLYWDKDHPCMVNVPIRDFFIDPTATDMDNAKYMGRRYLITKEELKEYQIVNPETGEMEDRYKNLDQIDFDSTSGEEMDKEVKDMFYGSTVQEPEMKQVECIEYWTKDRVITVANRSTVIEDTENWYKKKAADNGNEYAKGFYPFACLRDYVDESLFYATGEVDYIADEQELLNDITNQNIDSVTFTLNQMYTLDPKYAHLLDEIENIPGATYLAEANALQPIAQRSIPPDAFNERINLKNEIRETTASNEIVKGVGDESNATATEVNAQIAGAGQRLALKITQIENEGFHQLARIVFEMMRLYITEPMLIRVVGNEGVRFEEFIPELFEGEYEPRVQLESSINNQKTQQGNMVKEMYASFLGDPEVNQQELKRMVMTKAFDLDPDEVEMLLSPQQMPEMPMEDVVQDPLNGELMPLDPMEVPMGALDGLV